MRAYVPETKRPPRLGDADGPNGNKMLRWEHTQIGQRGQAQSNQLHRTLFLDGYVGALARSGIDLADAEELTSAYRARRAQARAASRTYR
jgi:hypothetical protein